MLSCVSTSVVPDATARPEHVRVVFQPVTGPRWGPKNEEGVDGAGETNAEPLTWVCTRRIEDSRQPMQSISQLDPAIRAQPNPPLQSSWGNSDPQRVPPEHRP